MSWSDLPAANRRWLIVNAVFVTAAINLALNYAIALVAVGDRDSVPMWGAPLVEPSVFWDLIGTLFLLPLFTSALVTASVRRDIRRGTMDRLAPLPRVHRLLASPSRWRRGAAFGGLTVLALAPGLLAILFGLDWPELSKSQFIAWHTGFAIVLGVVVTPPLALFAMAAPDPSPTEAVRTRGGPKQ
jgi:hypothetical protein